MEKIRQTSELETLEILSKIPKGCIKKYVSKVYDKKTITKLKEMELAGKSGCLNLIKSRVKIVNKEYEK